jgi:hypothetical protein
VLACSIPDADRIMILEDVAELSIRKPHVISAEAQLDTHKSQIGFPDLLKAALRHRPDRIIVGEIRGAEARVFLDALNTGHRGSLSIDSSPHDGIYCLGCINLRLYATDIQSSGAWNWELLPDAANDRSSDADHMYGGVLAYGGLGNFHDGGTTSNADQGNTLDGVIEEILAWTPQNLIEQAENDSISNSYIEYINTSGSQVANLYSTIVGNAPGSGIGTSTTATASSFRFINNTLGTPTAQGSYITASLELLNDSGFHAESVIDFGGPTYGIVFAPSGAHSFPPLGHSTLPGNHLSIRIHLQEDGSGRVQVNLC